MISATIWVWKSVTRKKIRTKYTLTHYCSRAAWLESQIYRARACFELLKAEIYVSSVRFCRYDKAALSRSE